MRKYSDETKNQILVLWNANMSAQRIADRFGLNKNMVIGILKKMRHKGLHVRIGKSPNKNPYKRSRSSGPKIKSQPITIYESPKDFIAPRSVLKSKKRWVSLLHLDDNSCRYTKDGKMFCNAPCKGSYCEEHPIGGGVFRGVNIR